MNAEAVKSFLFKEASQKVQQSKPASIAQAEIKSILLDDAEAKISSVKEASIEKEAMAAQIGVGDLKNSSWNTEWSIPDKTERILQVEQDIQKVFEPYLYSLIGGNQVPIKGGISLPDDPESPKPATFVLRFAYKRSLLPLEKVAPQAHSNAVNAISNLEQAIPGFEQFISDIQKYNIPLMPFYHTSVRSKESGGIDQEKLQKFLLAERSRYQQSQIPYSVPTYSDKFYSEHAQRIQNKQPVRATEIRSYTRKYSNDDIDEINDHSILMRAIAEKIKSGYTINWQELDSHLETEKQGYISMHKLDANDPLVNSYTSQFKKRRNKIIKSFKQGCLPQRGDPSALNWGVTPTGHFRPGLPQESEGKHTICPILSIDDLKLILKSLTQIDKNMRASNKFSLLPNEFVITNQSMTFKSNGWDSSPTSPETNMLTIPALKQLPGGQIVYDRDQGNMGRVHLMKYWRNGLGALVGGRGKWALENLQRLRMGDTIQILQKNAGNDKQTSLDAWLNIVGAKKRGNRTNAENILELLQKYPDWQSFSQNHLGKSLASEIAIYNKIEKNEIKDPRLLSLNHAYKSGHITWDEYGRQLSKFGLTTKDATDQKTMITEQDFETLQKYGYAVAKMMDLAFGVLTRSCEEIFKNRDGHVTEKIYGRQYSTSSGKYAEGQVMFGVRYAFNAPEIGSHDPTMLRMVRDERRKRHILKPGEGGDVYRSTNVPQKGNLLDQDLSPIEAQSIVKIVENVTYWVGQSSSTSNWFKPVYDDLSGLNWQQALDYVKRKYPGIEQQLGVVYEPMNADLHRIETASKRALTKVQEKLKAQNKPIEIVYIDKDKTEEVLDAATNINIEPVQERQIPSSGQGYSHQFSPLHQPGQPTEFSRGPQTQPQEIAPQPPAPTSIPPKTPKSMPMSNSMTDDNDFVRRRDNSKRRLIKKDIHPDSGKIQRSSLIGNLIKLADQYDQIGEIILSSKIDKLIEIINVQKNS